MKIVKIIVQVLLALVFLMVGFMKASTPYDEMIVTEGMTWAADFSANTILIIGIAEVLIGSSLILPLLLKKWHILIPVAALLIVTIMIGATYTHIGREEPIVPNIILGLVALLVFWWNKASLRS